MYITQRDVGRLLECGKVDAWVSAETCLGLFLLLLGLRCLFREYFRLRLYLFSSLGLPPHSARSHPDEQGSEDRAAPQEVGAGTDLCAFPSGSRPRCCGCGWGPGWPREVGLVPAGRQLVPARPPGLCPQHCDRREVVLQPKSPRPDERRKLPWGPASLGEVGGPGPFGQRSSFLVGSAWAGLRGEEWTRTEWVLQAAGQRALSCREGPSPKTSDGWKNSPSLDLHRPFPLRLSSVEDTS